jgi:hypothetical protein
MRLLHSNFRRATIFCAAAGFVAGFRALPLLSGGAPDAVNHPANVEQTRTPFTDYRRERPGAIRKITLADLPEPYRTQSADNRTDIVARFRSRLAEGSPGIHRDAIWPGLQNPRLIRSGANGDLFVAASEPGHIRVLRGTGSEAWRRPWPHSRRD